MAVIDLYLTYAFVKRLGLPFKDWPAYKTGVIDESGKILVAPDKRSTSQRESFGYFDTVARNLKRLLAQVPGGSSPVASIAAAMLLLKEERHITIEDLQTAMDVSASVPRLWHAIETLVEEDGGPTNVAAGVVGNDGSHFATTRHPRDQWVGGSDEKPLKRRRPKRVGVQTTEYHKTTGRRLDETVALTIEHVIAQMLDRLEERLALSRDGTVSGAPGSLPSRRLQEAEIAGFFATADPAQTAMDWSRKFAPMVGAAKKAVQASRKSKKERQAIIDAYRKKWAGTRSEKQIAAYERMRRRHWKKKDSDSLSRELQLGKEIGKRWIDDKKFQARRFVQMGLRAGAKVTGHTEQQADRAEERIASAVGKRLNKAGTAVKKGLSAAYRAMPPTDPVRKRALARSTYDAVSKAYNKVRAVGHKFRTRFQSPQKAVQTIAKTGQQVGREVAKLPGEISDTVMGKEKKPRKRRAPSIPTTGPNPPRVTKPRASKKGVKPPANPPQPALRPA